MVGVYWQDRTMKLGSVPSRELAGDFWGICWLVVDAFGKDDAGNWLQCVLLSR